MKKSHRRLLRLSLGLLSLTAGIFIFFSIFKDTMVFYYTPSEVFLKKNLNGQTIRIGGTVKKGSHQHDLSQGPATFILEDTGHEIPVRYGGILPPLFKEDTTAVVKGSLQTDGAFLAEEVLAKHDENYQPPKRRTPKDSML